MKPGFTLIELIVVIGIGLVILATTTVLLLGGQRRVTKISTVNQILSDIRTAQIKAMTGEGGGGDRGVYLGTNFYTLFNGTTYNANDDSNFVVNLDNNVELATMFPGASIVFARVSGEINNYINGSDTVSIIDATDNTDKVIRFNKYGVAISQN